MRDSMCADTPTWSDWQSVYDRTEYRDAAVYKVRIINARGEPFKIGRLFRTDSEGILNIGQTSSMEQRRRQSVTGIQEANGHSSMNLIYYLSTHTEFKQLFNEHQIQFSFLKCKDKQEAVEKEYDLIKTYFKKYGEVPPLNSALPKRYENWE